MHLLSREGFREISPAELTYEPYKSLAKMPVCFKANSPDVKIQSNPEATKRC
jgi:hypothetical protein